MKQKYLTQMISGVIGLTGLACLYPCTVIAEEKDQVMPMEEVLVTGSAIPRKDLESALPVEFINAAQIERSGVTTTAELMKRNPVIQAPTTPADSVGGGGGGVVTANLRGIGSSYTLVLLNGRRLAPSDSGSEIDLNGIPLGALGKVEILKDGASALYGSDAIAGVVNFMLKDEVDGTTINVRADTPQDSGGEKYVFDVTTGFGKFDTDGYSVVLGASFSEQSQLSSKDRDFAKSGIITFNHEGYDNPLYFFNGSPNAIPANARVVYSTGLDEDGDGKIDTASRTFNPYRLENGECAPKNSPSGTDCAFDYTSTIEIVPERKQNSFFANGKVKLADNLEGFFTGIYSKSSMTSRIAPYPTGYFTLPSDSSLVAEYVTPNLTDEERANLVRVDARWRALPAGNRTTDYDNTASNLVFGLKGELGVFNFDAAITRSNTELVQDYPTGWLLADEFQEVVSSGAINIFATPDQITADDLKALESSIYHGHWETADITVNGIDAKASAPIFNLGGGESIVAFGVDHRKTRYHRTIAEANEQELILFLGKDTEYNLTRSQYGLFTEFLFPFSNSFETTLSGRYDQIGGVRDDLNGVKVNDDEGDLTYKLSMKYQPAHEITLRASIGTGFKAPTMREIAEPRSDFGVTSGTYACPFSSSDPLYSGCLAGENQYNVYREGSAELKPEKSKQFSFGLVLKPVDNLNVTIDYWNIEMEDLVDRLTEQQIFDNAEQYRNKFTTKTNNATGDEELAIIQSAVNIASGQWAGVDWAFDLTNDLPFGQLTTTFSGSHMIEHDNSLYGSSLAQFGSDENVIFRNIALLSFGLETENIVNTLSLRYQSGYKDQLAEVTELEADGSFGDDVEIQLDIDSSVLVDWQLDYSLMESQLMLSAGITNLFDEKPPLSLRVNGAGHQVGWEPRYFDAYGRTLFLKARYTFGH